VGKKRGDYDDLGYPRSRTAPGWFTSSTDLPMSSADAVIRSVAGMEPYRSAADSRKNQNKKNLKKIRLSKGEYRCDDLPRQKWTDGTIGYGTREKARFDSPV
jgi:hypothetical protein